GHVQCDKLAPLCQELPGKAGITFFTTDFEFALFNIQGTRLFQPLRAYLTELGFSMEYHARMTRTPRADLLGFSWREVPWEELHLPKQHTPWDGKKALQPAERSSKDCASMRDALQRFPQLKVGVIQGHGKCLNPIRLQVLGGLASITKSAPRKGELVQPDLCPFCTRKPVDSLDHAVNDCLMNKWSDACAWAATAICTIRERFLVSTVVALLDFACPLRFDEASHRTRSAPTRGRKRARGTIQSVPFDEVQRRQRERSTPDLAELATRKWVEAQRCSIQVKLSTVRNIKTDTARGFPAVRLLKAACEQQQAELRKVESEWKRRTGSTANLGEDAEETHFCLGLESRTSDSSKLSDAEPLNRLTQLEQALLIWAGQHLNGALFSLSTGVGAGMRTLRLDERFIPTAGSALHEACFYAGVIRDSDSLDMVSQHSRLHDRPIIMILAAHLTATDSHSAGPLLDWPLPPVPSDRATGAYSSEKIQELNATVAPARLTLLHSPHVVRPTSTDPLRDLRELAYDSPGGEAKYRMITCDCACIAVSACASTTACLVAPLAQM
ncbi:MAG: hypothetical protein WCK17_15495, partial [Verrucomicrobiota bacterium]